MAFIEYNPNPRGINTGDCVIRAICKALDMDWEKVYMDLTVRGLQQAMWGDTNSVWEKYLREKGFVQEVLPSTCPDCYTIAEDGEIEPIQLTISINGEPDPSSTMIATPAAVGDFQNVGAEIFIAVPSLCGCESISVRNTSTQAIDVQNANLTVDYIGVRRVI